MAREIFEEECGGWSDFRRRAVIENIEQLLKNEKELEELAEREGFNEGNQEDA